MTARTPIPQDMRETVSLATEKQVAYLKALRDGKDLTGLTTAQIEWLISVDFATIPKNRASDVIEQLVKQPWKPKDVQERQAELHASVRNAQAIAEAKRKEEDNLPVSMNDLPDGYYAVRNVEGHKNEISFFRLRSPKQGKWVGYQFTDQVVGHGKRFPVKDSVAREKIHVLIREQGVTECQQLYGQEIGACGRCGRELTDDTSRRRGIGPDCWAIMGGN